MDAVVARPTPLRAAWIASTMVMLRAFMARGRFRVILPQAPDTRTTTSLIVSVLRAVTGRAVSLSVEDHDLANGVSAAPA